MNRFKNRVSKAGHARNPRNKDSLTARSHALAWSLKTQRSQRKAGRFFSFAGLAANEKAALSKTVSRFWTIDLLRVYNFAYLAALRFKGLPREARGYCFL
ncbi:hypothetical protein Dthio_PD0401 [Desulfonatronospira thiodismutans ASO3-1]|uniref:Uncharacterized protein n=1 Tax=Desulfonatronospira thiodismutans ASO3-1 TaxID=555779 RepID=D6SUV6_9BACT|nr:hypothetical protein [Desulfonatronospira thiodismutans]EFI33086.1 hypothetical protein Dthio_PD0401 [Desulfonatronospira thiodismutans ASO3-1]